jgi:Cu/Ag efflux pump CusA
LLVLGLGAFIYRGLESEFLPPLDEGGFVIDYIAPFGTSLAETDRQLLQAEEILRATPEVESYSRRTGARLALSIAEPNTGDFLVKLKPDRRRATPEVVADLRHRFQVALPRIEWEFPGILSDLIGDLIWAPQPIEVKLFSTDIGFLKKKAPEVADELRQVRGVVDVLDGLIYAGPSLSFKVRPAEVERLGLSASDVADAVSTAMLGETASTVLQGDRVIAIRVLASRPSVARLAALRDLPLRTPDGTLVKLSQVVDVEETPGQLELRREDLRQDVAVTARLSGRDLGSAMAEIRDRLSRDASLPPGTLEFGGLYQQQQESPGRWPELRISGPRAAGWRGRARPRRGWAG